MKSSLTSIFVASFAMVATTYGCTQSTNNAAPTGVDAGGADGSPVVVPDGGGSDSALTDAPSSDASSSDAPAEAAPTGDPNRVVGLALGASHSCVLLSGGTVWCWGGNQYGAFGTGSADANPRYTATQVPGITDVVQLVSTWKSLCARKKDGSLWCWGLDDAVQFAHSNVNDATCAGQGPCVATPTQIQGIPAIVDVAAGYAHFCARATNGDILCWGANQRGELGHDNTNDVACTGIGYCNRTPTIVPSAPTTGMLTAGASFTCAGGGANVMCWGTNAFGEIAYGVRDNVLHPTPNHVTALPADVVEIASGGSDTCVRTQSGDQWCWGSNYWGQIFDKPLAQPGYQTPVKATLATGAVVRNGQTSSCALLTDKTVECWGRVDDGESGSGLNYGTSCNNGYRCNMNPTKLNELANVALLAVGWGQNCAVERDGSVWCWGVNDSGVLGHDPAGDTACRGSLQCTYVPSRVLGLPAIADM